MKNVNLSLFVSFVLVPFILILFTSCPDAYRSPEEMRAYCDGLENENLFWRAMGGENPENLPESATASMGVAMFLLASPMTEFPEDQRRILREKAMILFRSNARLYLTKEEFNEVARVLTNSESVPDRLSALQKINRTDVASSEFLERVLNDEERIAAFLLKKPIPPRIIPACCSSYHNRSQ